MHFCQSAMDQIDEGHEDASSELHNKSLTLSTTSPGLGVRKRSERSNEGSVAGDDDWERDTSFGHGKYRVRNKHSDFYHDKVTPRQQNRKAGSKPLHSKSSSPTSEGLPSAPFRADRSMRSVQSQSSVSRSSQGTKKGQVDFNDEESEPSLHLHSLYGPVSPASLSVASYSKRTPDSSSRRGIQAIAMDGTITSLPLSTAEKDNEASATTRSTANSKTPTSPSKRTREAMHKSYFAAAQEMMFLDSMSLQESNSNIEMTEGHPDTNTNRSKDFSMDTDESDEYYDPIIFFGFICPVWFTSLVKGAPSLNRISRCLVNVLPCFWCCNNTAQNTTSDRAVLARLNIVCLLMTLVQFTMAMWLVFTLLILDDEPGIFAGFSPHFWNCNGATFSIGILAFLLMIACSHTIRIAKEVDYSRATRSLWIVLWIMPFEIFFNISLYDYYNVSVVWIRHWWVQNQMSWFRLFFCEEGTAYSTCLVPIDGGAEYESEADWCMVEYNTTGCSKVRDDAQEWMNTLMLTFYTGLAGWSSVLLGFLVLLINSLERIVTKPIVQKSRESNVPAWLFLPTITNTIVGIILVFSPSSLLSESVNPGQETSWIGFAYILVGILFLASLLAGWFLSAYTINNQGDKKTKSIAAIVLIIMMAVNVAILAAIFIGSILLAASLINSPIDEKERGVVACQVDRGTSCTMCAEEVDAADRCPEWSLDEVTKIIQTQLKQSATLGAIFILYAISVLRFALTLRKHLSLYQIDYV